MRTFEETLEIREIQDVYDLTEALRNIDCDMDLLTEQRRYVVDAKSMLGILSLDLSGTLILRSYTDDVEKIRAIKAAVRKIGVKQGS